MYNILVPIGAFVSLAIVAVVWRAYLSAYIKRQKKEATVVREKGLYEVMLKLRPILAVSCICSICSILLGNSDEKAADALQYIKPSACLDHILEKRNG